jgi:hypothetical protein
MTYKAPNREALQAECDAFNFDCKVGGRVAVKIDGTDKPLITTTRSEAQILSGHAAVVWLDGVPGCWSLGHVTPIPDPHAWAVYAENGNVRIWSYRRDVVERVALSCGAPVEPYTPQPEPAWSATPPTEPGEHWHWDGHHESAPTIINVLYMEAEGMCFVPLPHCGRAIMCNVYGGYWKRLRKPETPR